MEPFCICYLCKEEAGGMQGEEKKTKERKGGGTEGGDREGER